MEPLTWMGIGATAMMALVMVAMIAKKGWTWVQTEIKSHAATIEADFQAKVKAAFDVEAAAIKNDIAALKAKVGL